MPTYEYACKTCDEHVEVVQSFKDGPLTTCPKCGGPLRKVFGSIGIAFKGSGFYKTDTRKEPKSESSSTPAKEGAAAKKSSSDKAAASSASSSSSESGSAPKAAAS